jgi:glycosyltransferase involved in cell wall biosynthesis
MTQPEVSHPNARLNLMATGEEVVTGTALASDDRALLENRRVVVVMPAYNAAKTLELTWRAIPKEWVYNVIVVDDRSRDQTVEIAQSLPIELIAHPHNVGYGGNQKTCYMEALRQGADVVVMLHPDGQYDPALIPALVRPILRGEADMVLGSRFLDPGGARKGGMPFYKFVANRFLTTTENLVLQSRFAELHTGYRAYSRHFLTTIPFLRNSNDFVFDTEVIAQAVQMGLRIVEVPVSTHYFPAASSTTFRQSVAYGLKTLATMAKVVLHRRGLIRSRLFRQ